MTLSLEGHINLKIDLITYANYLDSSSLLPIRAILKWNFLAILNVKKLKSMWYVPKKKIYILMFINVDLILMGEYIIGHPSTFVNTISQLLKDWNYFPK